jgi:hypothetical protein
MAVFLSSCSKDLEKVKEETKTPQPIQVQSREEFSSLFGNDHIVPAYVARTLAEKINMAVPEVMRIGSISTTRVVDSLFTISDSLGTPVMYIANYVEDGYIVVSADERHEPICALVNQGKYETTEVPSMLLEWLDITFENILLVRSGVISSSNFADGEWARVIKDIGEEEYLTFDDCCPECPNYPECLTHPTIGCGEPDIHCEGGGGNDDPCWPYTTNTKGPLMTTKWGQECSYNNQCPDLDCPGVCSSHEHALTGCVATALAQVIRYWSHPCSQNYDYSTMPNGLGNSEVQRLMRNAGDAVDMDYGCDASSADGDKTDNALKDDFCYSSASRSGYSSGSYQTVVQNIDANKPVLLDGCRTRKKKFPWLWYTYSNCHLWVCDGYERHQNSCYSILKFHMNWGWRGNHNGWYYYNSWNTGSSNYQYAQEFTYNIHP